MEIRTRLLDAAQVAPEKGTLQYSVLLEDEAGAILGNTLDSLKLTLYDLSGRTQAIINAIDGIDIMNTGRGSLDTLTGRWTVTLGPADNIMLNAAQPYERHLMLLQWTYASGAKAGKHEVEFLVRHIAHLVIGV